MLADLDRKRRQLRQPVPRRRTTRRALLLAEDVTATAARRPVLDDLGHPLDREQRPPVPEMAGLSACFRPVPRDRPRFPSQAGSWLGGNDELRESRFNRCSSSSTRSVSAASCASCASSRADSASSASTTGSRPAA